MRQLFKILLITLSIPVAVIGIFMAVFALSVHFKTESKITAALSSVYPHATISINDRVDWDYANEVCFDVTVHQKSRRSAERRIVMVRGDDDGGTWILGRRQYVSMIECRRHFCHG